jgi:hypothetical protein
VRLRLELSPLLRYPAGFLCKVTLRFFVSQVATKMALGLPFLKVSEINFLFLFNLNFGSSCFFNNWLVHRLRFIAACHQTDNQQPVKVGDDFAVGLGFVKSLIIDISNYSVDIHRESVILHFPDVIGVELISDSQQVW